MKPEIVAKLVYAISRDPALQHHEMVAKLNEEFADLQDSSKLVFGDAAKKVNYVPPTNWQLENQIQGYKNQTDYLNTKLQERDKAVEKLESKLHKLEKKLNEAEAERYRAVVNAQHVINDFYLRLSFLSDDEDEVMREHDKQIRQRFKTAEAKAAKWDALKLLIGGDE